MRSKQKTKRPGAGRGVLFGGSLLYLSVTTMRQVSFVVKSGSNEVIVESPYPFALARFFRFLFFFRSGFRKHCALLNSSHLALVAPASNDWQHAEAVQHPQRLHRGRKLKLCLIVRWGRPRLQRRCPHAAA
jgi:hypothetical protein